MKIIKTRTKLESIGITLFMLAICFTSVFATTLSDPSGDTMGYGVTNPTYFSNSRGHTYDTSTYLNFMRIVWDLNDTGGGEVEVPICDITFIDTATFTNVHNITVRGTGMSWFRLGPLVDNPLIKLDGCDGWIIEQINFDMNNASQTQPVYNGLDPGGHPWYDACSAYEHCDAIELTGDSDFNTIQNCKFTEGYGALIQGLNDADNNYVYHNSFIGRAHYRYRGAITIRGHGWIVENNYMQDMYGCAVHIEAGTTTPQVSAEENLVTGNEITGYVAIGIASEGGRKSLKNTFIGNNIHDIDSDCYLTNFSAGDPSDYVDNLGIQYMNNTIIGYNRITNCSYQAIAGYGSVIIHDNIIIECGWADEGSVISGASSSVFGRDKCFSTAHHNIIYTSIGADDCPNYVINGINIVTDNSMHFDGDTLPEVGIRYARVATGNIIENITIGILCDYQNGLTISNNNITNYTYSGIEVKRSGKASVLGNYLHKGVGSAVGIRLDRANNNTVSSNIVENSPYGIREATGTPVLDYNDISHNILVSCATPMTKVGTHTKLFSNIGYITENLGNTSVANNATIAHGLATTPTYVEGHCWQWNVGVQVKGYTATTFTVHFYDLKTGLDLTGPYYVQWKAEV